MKKATGITDGLYRLIKLQEDHNPVFPGKDMIVEVRDDRIINLATGRSSPLASFGETRCLFGPLAHPYDHRPLDRLARIDPAAYHEKLSPSDDTDMA